MTTPHLQSFHCMRFILNLVRMWTQVCTGRKSFKSQVIHQFFLIFMLQFVGFLFPPLFLMPGAYMLLKLQLVLPTQNFFITSPVHNNTAQQAVLLSMLQHPNFFLIYLFPGLIMHRIFTILLFHVGTRTSNRVLRIARNRVAWGEGISRQEAHIGSWSYGSDREVSELFD